MEQVDTMVPAEGKSPDDSWAPVSGNTTGMTIEAVAGVDTDPGNSGPVARVLQAVFADATVHSQCAMSLHWYHIWRR